VQARRGASSAPGQRQRLLTLRHRLISRTVTRTMVRRCRVPNTTKPYKNILPVVTVSCWATNTPAHTITMRKLTDRTRKTQEKQPEGAGGGGVGAR